jgi:DNA replication protein DnaC
VEGTGPEQRHHRYLANLPTVITSNRSPNSLEPRIVSRMHQRAYRGELLRISAEDYRRCPPTT